MPDWLTPGTALSLGTSLALIAAAWGNLRARVDQQGRQIREERKEALEAAREERRLVEEKERRQFEAAKGERDELRVDIGKLRTDIDRLLQRNGSPRVMSEIQKLEERCDAAEARALQWIPVISTLQAKIDVAGSEAHETRAIVRETRTLLAEVKIRQDEMVRKRE